MKVRYKVNVSKNKSITYMFPLVHDVVNFRFQQFLLNSYISFDDDDMFCVMYKWSSDPGFLKYEKELTNSPLYIGHADFGEKVVYKFNLTIQMKKERELFVLGKYEEFSESHKDCILEYMRSKGFKNTSRIARILSKDGDLYSDPPEMDKETLSKNVKEIVINPENFEV